MALSWTKFVSGCKSRLSALARSCFLRRLHWFRKYQEAKQAQEELREALAERDARCRQLEQENEILSGRVSELEAELAEPRPIELPLGEAPPRQQYGDNLIALCVNLARKLGARPTNRALEIFFAWLDVDVSIPSHETIRLWMQRVGLGRMQLAEKKVGGTWLVDHTNQIGKEKVLTVLRVRSSQQGVALRHRDVEVLAVVPGTECKRDDVAKTYQQIAERYGTPDSVVTDGAVELRESVGSLGEPDKRPRVFRDLKHFLANRVEASLKRDPKWEAFTTNLGRSRSALQQTELAHFIPPAFKPKARFMNLASTLNWASAVLWHLDHPESKSRENVSEERMQEKMGWLRGFAASISQWQECQNVVTTTLAFINQEGIFHGVTNAYQKAIADIAQNPASQELASNIANLLSEYEGTLKPGERLRISTEILESSFSLYKDLEQQHSKSGFTSLLLTFPTLLSETTAEEVTHCFAEVKVANVKAWAKANLPNTLTAARQRMFQEAKPNKPKRKRKNRATSISHAA